MNDIQAEELLLTSTSWDGSLLPEYGSGQPEVEVVKIVVPPSGQVSLHTHPVINAGVILSGELVFQSEDGRKEVHLLEGEAYADVVNQWHKGFNPGHRPTVILIFHAGLKGKPLAIKQS